MINTKLSGYLVAFLIVSSCIFFVVSFAAANPIEFPTPTPTATPVPEPTPTPMPKPEPTTWPTLEVQCITTAAASNLTVQVSGTLTFNQTGIPNAAIYVGYSADCGNSWENFSLVQTRGDGSFGAVWVPNATGNYLVNAHWDGNDSLHWFDARMNLALTSDSSGNVLSAVSNSTISSFAYNSTTQILSFNTNGTSGTTGYVYASIPKNLVSDIQTLEVNIDGKSIAFGSESQGDVWVISCVYSQSEHVFTVQIPSVGFMSPATMPWTTIVVIAAVIALIAVLAVVVVIRRRRRTAATVAAILKENRPLH